MIELKAEMDRESCKVVEYPVELNESGRFVRFDTAPSQRERSQVRVDSELNRSRQSSRRAFDPLSTVTAASRIGRARVSRRPSASLRRSRSPSPPLTRNSSSRKQNQLLQAQRK
mmetsp:Transcript_6909/g.12371  ORF Transcript_6909/g.12371 Transcript_6909/m.12371 type:complete len:114 (-) Transcript_6909:112-453(-)